MRLWHEKLIQSLPRNQLLGQHRECCALRGKGWGKRHSTVNYVFEYSPYLLYKYHLLVMEEMNRRGYRVSEEWFNKDYRGKNMERYENLIPVEVISPIYQEHNEEYLIECLENLENKHIFLEIE
ncbi:MAG: hypothetical protein GX145_06885 [Clostridiaceae bacterium]|jgi:uncharacterized protein (TIGR02328 family)|nr:hypothetical protein [Clostridiaceae bacterium]